MRRIKLLLNTIKYLKSVQVFYQIKYRLQKPKSLAAYNSAFDSEAINFLSFKENPPVYQSYLGNNEFVFLNQKKQFDRDFIEWKFQEFGKLWNYNLQYGNYLLQQEISMSEKERLLMSLYESLNSGKLSMEPYPTSLRIINVIRFYSLLNFKSKKGISFLHAELNFLSKRLEFHLLGNHLLENVFALIMGGAFFSNNEWMESGQKILEEQLNEQILADGAHLELSPMYHQIIFFRILELIDWYSSWPSKNKKFQKFLITYAQKMRSWLENISFKNGDIPHFNDSAEGISYSTKWLIGYADCLKINSANIPLGVSGYRSVQRGNYECKIDFAAIGPDYQPGHAHADALSFILYYKNKPLFVEAGTSTYEPNNKRQQERSTESHNTVVVQDKNQSEVYGSFRVGRRARTRIILEKENELAAEHNGYASINHCRHFYFNVDELLITDVIRNNSKSSTAYFHFPPGFEIALDNLTCIVEGICHIEFDRAIDIRKITYKYSNGFNNLRDAPAITVEFSTELKTLIKFY